MTNVKPSRITVLLIYLLGIMLTGQAGVQGYVLCLCQGGHAALEYAANYTCSTGAQQQSQDCHGKSAFDHPSSEEPCGPCFDVPAGYEAAARRTQDHQYVSGQIVHLPLAKDSRPANFVQILATTKYPQPSPRVSQTILSHRTVVLLN